MKFNIKIILTSIIAGIIIFIVSSLGFFTLVNTDYLGIPFQFVTGDCEGELTCDATPIFHWGNAIADVIFWSTIFYFLIKIMRSKGKKY